MCLLLKQTLKISTVLFLLLIVTGELLAEAPDLNASHGTESEPAQGTGDLVTINDKLLLDEDASEVFVRMTDFIAALPAFTLVSDTGHEVLQKNGHMLEFGSQLSLAVQRPSKAIGRFDSRDGGSSTIVLDGSSMWLYGTKENMYDKTQQPGDIDASLEHLSKQFSIPLQLRHFFSKDLTATLSSAVKSGYYVGESMIGGQLCDHLALRGDAQDVQVWIAKGHEPVPRRIVITYTQIEGQPRFWAQFTEWDFAPQLSDATFKFSPPENAERVQLFLDKTGYERE